MIYLASPYSHPDEDVRDGRYFTAYTVTGMLLSAGLPVFSPIVYGHPLASSHSLGTCAKTWEELNTPMVRACSYMLVLCIDGWEESTGVTNEIDLARRLDKTILYINPEGRIINPYKD